MSAWKSALPEPIRLALADTVNHKAQVQLLSPVETLWILTTTADQSEAHEPAPPLDLAVQCKEDAWQFADRNGLVQPVITYTKLARKFFTVVGSTDCRIAKDPETNEKFLVLHMNISGSLEDILSSEDRFRSSLVRAIAPEKLYHIRFSYNAL